MVAGAATEAGDRAAGGHPPAATAAAPILDPELIMAARRGDSKRLKELLKLNDDDGDEQVIVEVDHRRSAAAAAPCGGGSAEALQLLDGVTPNEGDSLLHVVAACGDGDKFVGCAKMIYRNSKRLLLARNENGDTTQLPLHCAAGAGNAGMVACLVALATGSGKTKKEELLRLRNKRGETAMHQAVRAASKACIDQLMSVDPELACVPPPGEEDEGASPLYLAVSLDDMEIARHLFFRMSKSKLSSYSGPGGRNVLHVAVSRGKGLPELLEWFKDVTVDVQQGDHHISVPLVSHLTMQRDKLTGSTPLHLAASLEGWLFEGPLSKWFELLSAWFPRGFAGPKSTALLIADDANTSSVYQPDSEGMYPIHVAAMNGSLSAIKILLQKYPDCATLRDAKGRTFLHVAVERGRCAVVRHACRRIPPQSSSVLNAQDSNGDTALHRAVDVGNMEIFNCLIRNRHVHLSVPNKEGLTPRDLSWSKIPTAGFDYAFNPTTMIRTSLLLLGASHGESRPDHFYEISFPRAYKKAQEDMVSQNLTDATQVMGIVSVLVATVTFASAFILPGGYRSADSNDAATAAAGTPVLAGSYAFEAFIFADTLAFICSCLATCSLVFAGVPAVELCVRIRYMHQSYVFLRSSVTCLAVAFALGLYLVLAPVAHLSAIAVYVIICASLLYGNSEAWQVMRAAYTACARGLGPMKPSTWAYALFLFLILSVHYISFIIIFGLPAIRRRYVDWEGS
ncbi:hypothetical protein ACP70R_042114 [Stipagrostis hirtigluma subsp. patula]